MADQPALDDVETSDPSPAPEPDQRPADDAAQAPAEAPRTEPAAGEDQPDQDTNRPGTEGIAPSAEMVRFANGQGLLTVDPDQKRWTPEQRVALTAIGIPTTGEDAVPPGYVAQFLHVCQSAGLDPWRKEAYLITYGKRWSRGNGEVVDNRKHSLVIGIDGFRKRGEDTGQYRGQVGPQWAGDDGAWREFWAPKWGVPVAARVGVMREGFDAPVWGVVMYDEMVAMVDEYEGERGNRRKTGRKVPTESWDRMPALMLAKCAEAAAFRKAFPRTFTGMYATEELSRAQAEHAQAEAEFAAQRRREAMERAQQAVPTTIASAVADVADQIRPEAPDQPDQRSTAPSDNGPAADSAEQERWLRDELTYQAGVLGHPPARLALRATRALRKNVEDFTVAELAPVVLGMRGAAIARLREHGNNAEADSYAGFGQAIADVMGSLGSEPVVGDVVNPDEDHRFSAADGGGCIVCGLPEDVGPHVD